MSAAPPRTATSLPQNGGNDVIRAATRRRHAASQLLMLHPPAGQIGNQRRAYSPRLVPNCGAGGRGQDLAGLQNDADHPPAHQAPPFVEGTARPAEPGRGAGGRRGLDGMCTAMKSPTGVEGTGGLGRASRSTTPSRRFTHGGNREARGAWPRCRWVPVGGGRAWPGFEIDHSEPQARVWRSRGRPDPTATGTPVGPQATSNIGNRAGRRPPAHTAPQQPAPTTKRGRDRFPGHGLVTHSAPLTEAAAPPAIRRSCPRGPRPRRGQPRGGRRGRGTGSRTRSRHPRCGRSGSTAGRHRARHTRRA